MMKFPPEDNSLMKYAAFLRGINVGGNTVVKMEALRKEFEDLGFRKVKTTLASGNVVFEGPEGDGTLKLSRDISQQLKQKFGKQIRVIVRPLDDLRTLAASDPFKGIESTKETRFFVTFLPKTGKTENGPPPTLQQGLRIVSVTDGIVCSVLEEQPGVDTVQLMASIEKEYGREVTTRSWKTIERLLKIG